MARADLDDVLAVVRDARVGGTFQERAAAVAGSLGLVVPHAHLAALPLVAAGGAGPSGAGVYVSPALADAWRSIPPYFPHYFEADPRRSLFAGGFGRIAPPSGRLVHFGAVLHPRPFGRDAFTGEFLPFTRTRYLVDLLLDRPDGTQFTFSLLRERTQGDFSSRELRLLELLAPDLSRMAQVAALEEELASPSRAQHVAFLVDGRGQVLSARDADAAALRALASRGARLQPVIRACLAALEARLAVAGELAEELAPTPEGWLRVTCGLLRTTGPGARAVVTLSPVTPGSREHFEAQAARAGLSPREREVAALAARGLSDREVGRALGVAVVTVKAHLRAAYRKTSARGRTRLAALLLGDRPPLVTG